MENLRGIGVDGYGLKFNRKSGEVTTVLTGNVPMLRAQSLKGIAKTQDYLIRRLKDFHLNCRTLL